MRRIVLALPIALIFYFWDYLPTKLCMWAVFQDGRID